VVAAELDGLPVGQSPSAVLHDVDREAELRLRLEIWVPRAECPLSESFWSMTLKLEGSTPRRSATPRNRATARGPIAFAVVRIWVTSWSGIPSRRFSIEQRVDRHATRPAAHGHGVVGVEPNLGGRSRAMEKPRCPDASRRRIRALISFGLDALEYMPMTHGSSR
jgi:hypothetical protein